MFQNLIKQIQALPFYITNIIIAIAALLTGLIFKIIVTLLLKLYSKTSNDFSLFKSILKRFNRPFTLFLPLLTLNLGLPLMELTKLQYAIIYKIANISLIISVAFVLIAIIKIFEDIVYHVYDLSKANNLRERKIRTQLQFIRKLLISIIVILTIGAILVSFSSLRRIGTGLLTGVGIGGIIVGLAAQRSLGNLLAGLQIAFTQPLRIDDVLVVEGEFGRVEEITLTYVVLSLWDKRRLILPINYFLEKPFQNWTRTSANILATVFLYLDYTAPFDALRSEFDRLLQASPLWDKDVSGLQVTDSTSAYVAVRMLFSAPDSGTAFDLRCYIRENMISFVQKNYPEALSKQRSAIVSNEDKFSNAAAATAAGQG